jgi:transposase
MVVGAGVDKRTHTVVAVDGVGGNLGEKVVEATAAGRRQAARWAGMQFGVELVWAIEDCRHLSARLQRDLSAADQKVVRVPPTLTALTRKSARRRGNSDPIDAVAVAFLREPDLPVAAHVEVSRELKLLVGRREDSVGQRTSTINRLLWQVHELDPAPAPKTASLDLSNHRKLLGDRGHPERSGRRAGRDQPAHRNHQCLSQTDRPMRRCERRSPAGDARLWRAGLGQTPRRNHRSHPIQSEAAFGSHSGVAPIPVWSGNTVGRVRLTRSSNHQLDTARHRIAVTHSQLNGLGHTYDRKRLAAGASSTVRPSGLPPPPNPTTAMPTSSGLT